jgi:hypothetical protein
MDGTGRDGGVGLPIESPRLPLGIRADTTCCFALSVGGALALNVVANGLVLLPIVKEKAAWATLP